MNRHRPATSLVLAVLATLALAGPAVAQHQVPFHGRLEGDVTNVPLDPPFASVLVEGTGQAAHLGRFTFEFPHVVDRSDSTGVGTLTFTAANGDTLTADLTGQGMPTGTPGFLFIVSTATITGGTGRFAGATGGFVVERLYDIVGGTTIGTFDGTISNRRGR